MLNGEKQIDFDGNRNDLRGYRSLLKGTEPIIKNFSTFEEEMAFLVENIKKLLLTYQPESICLIARKNEMLGMYAQYLEENEIGCLLLDKNAHPRDDNRIRLGTMHRVKGLEFACVFIASVNEGIVPRESVIKGSSDPMLRAERLQMEKALLFVAATRARDLLFITSYGKPSRFL
jgi:superfamily I DNA and RNA helicase